MAIIIKIIFLLCVLPLSVFANSSVKSEQSSLGNHKVLLTVAIGGEGYFPYNYIENEQVKGFSIDVLNYIEENSNYEFEFITLPWPRALHLVAEGKVDLILTLFKKPEREEVYHFIEPSYGHEINQLFKLANRELVFNGKLQQLTSYSIGTIREYSYGKAFDEATYLTKLPVLTEEILLKLLLGKRVDAAISNPLTFKELLLKNNLLTKVEAISPYIAKTPVYMALSKNRENAHEIKATLGKVTEQLKNSLYYQDLLNKYQLNVN